MRILIFLGVGAIGCGGGSGADGGGTGGGSSATSSGTTTVGGAGGTTTSTGGAAASATSTIGASASTGGVGGTGGTQDSTFEELCAAEYDLLLAAECPCADADSKETYVDVCAQEYEPEFRAYPECLPQERMDYACTVDNGTGDCDSCGLIVASGTCDDTWGAVENCYEGFECLEEAAPTGEPAQCEGLAPVPDNSCCTLCAASLCCEALGNCLAFPPANVCGGPGGADGEIAAFQQCMIDRGAEPGTQDGSDFQACFTEVVDAVSRPMCSLEGASREVRELATCLHGDEIGLDGCFSECFTDFDDDLCNYGE